MGRLTVRAQAAVCCHQIRARTRNQLTALTSEAMTLVVYIAHTSSEYDGVWSVALCCFQCGRLVGTEFDQDSTPVPILFKVPRTAIVYPIQRADF